LPKTRAISFQAVARRGTDLLPAVKDFDFAGMESAPIQTGRFQRQLGLKRFRGGRALPDPDTKRSNLGQCQVPVTRWNLLELAGKLVRTSTMLASSDSRRERGSSERWTGRFFFRRPVGLETKAASNNEHTARSTPHLTISVSLTRFPHSGLFGKCFQIGESRFPGRILALGT